MQPETTVKIDPVEFNRMKKAMANQS